MIQFAIYVIAGSMVISGLMAMLSAFDEHDLIGRTTDWPFMIGGAATALIGMAIFVWMRGGV